jgi:DNA-binding transcriptional ArsR family regulator
LSVKTEAAVRLFESLASPIRLEIYRAVMRRAPGGMVAGEIAAALDLPPANTSFHLKAMTQAGLLTVAQEGRFQRYRADLDAMRGLLAYITEECCAGSPELCVPRKAARR